MSKGFSEALARLNTAAFMPSLRALQRGVEKESLRVNMDGGIALTPHPEALGAALTHPHITTDFSEALLEFITPVCSTVEEVTTWLNEIHFATYAALENELLWTSSMPCVLPIDEGIPIAQYGSSNIATMKQVYRSGLGHRYGRAMQTIAGIHYNFSFSDEFWQLYKQELGSELSLKDFKTEQYFHLIRNFRRFSWLLVYLFGASPALCKTFLAHDQHGLSTLRAGTLFTEYGTSLRMGDLGYQSAAQESLYVCYNSLSEYRKTLSGALNQPYPDYEAIGTHRDGQRIQLNTSLLQIENEFYSSVRPKRVANSGEAPLNALSERGVQYIEVRCLDINPYLPLGINASTIRFVDSFLLYCLLSDSPPISPEENRQLNANNKTVVNAGRNPEAKVIIAGKESSVVAAAENILRGSCDCSALLDTAKKSSDYSDSCQAQMAKLQDPAMLPSFQVLQDLRDNDISYYEFAMRQSRAHQASLSKLPMAADRQKYFSDTALKSVRDREARESADTVSFEQFLQDYNERNWG